MFIIKKLIIKEWYRFFIASAFVLFLLLTTGNLISGFLRGNVTPIEVLSNYILELPGFLTKIFPISCLIASLFSINKLLNRNELTAIFAGGYKRKRLVFDLIHASLGVAILQFMVGAYLQPYLKSKRNIIIGDSAFKFRNLKKKGLSSSSIGAGKLWYKSKNYYFSFANYEKNKKTLNKINLYSFNKNYKLEKQISANKALHKNGTFWTFKDAKVLELLSSKTGFPKITLHQELDYNLHETPQDLEKIESDITTLSIRNLYSYIQTLKESGINTFEYEIIFLDKFSSSLICIILTILGAISIFNPNRRGTSFGKNIFVIFVFTIIYWLVYSYCLELGRSSKLNPYIACFIVPALFSLFLGYFFIKNRKLT